MKTLADQTHYELLDLPADANQEAIDRAFDKAMLICDPGSLAAYSLADPAEARRLLERVEEAYLTLSDPELRAGYDAVLRSVAAAGQDGDGALHVGAPASAPSAPHAAVALVESENDATRSAEPPHVPDTPPPDLEDAPRPVEPVRAPVPCAAPTAAGRTAPSAVDEPCAMRAIPAPESTILAAMAAASSPADGAEPGGVGPVPYLVGESRERAPAPGSGFGSDTVRTTATEAPQAAERGPSAAPASLVVRAPEPSPIPFAPPLVRREEEGGLPQPTSAAIQRSPAARTAGSLRNEPPPAARPNRLDTPRATTPLREPPVSKPAVRTTDIPPNATFNGELLRRVREGRGIALRDLAERTKISSMHLDNIEADRYDLLPAPVYLRGFLMLIARELKLDPLRVSKGYLELAARARPPA